MALVTIIEEIVWALEQDEALKDSGFPLPDREAYMYDWATDKLPKIVKGIAYATGAQVPSGIYEPPARPGHDDTGGDGIDD